MSIEQRVAEIEEAFQLFAAILTGEPTDATNEEKTAALSRFAVLMEGMKARLCE